MRRMGAVLLSGILAVSLLVTGCTSQKGADNTASQRENAGNEKDTGQEKTADQMGGEKDEPITISWLAYQTDAQPDPDSKIVKAVEERYNVKFDFWFVDNQKWDDALNIKFAAGEMPDVFRLKTKGNLDKYVQQGVIGELPITMLEEKAPNYMNMIEKWDTEKLIWMPTRIGDKNYGFTFPAIRNTYPTSLVWRLDWLKTVGIEKVPETLEEFETAMYKFAKEDPDGNGIDDTYGLSNSVMGTVLGAFGPMAINDFKGNPLPALRWQKEGEGVRLSAITLETRQGLELLQKWYRDGIIDPEFITGENTGGYWALSQAFMNGKVGVTGNVMYDHWAPPLVEGDLGGSVYQEFLKINPDKVYGEDFILGKAPVGPKGVSGTDMWGYVSETMVLSSECLKDRKKVDIILKMLDDFVADEEYCQMIRQGFEGEDYIIDSEGNLIQKITDLASRVKKGIQVFTFLSTIPEYEKKFSPKLYAFADENKGIGHCVIPVPSTEAATLYMTTLQTLTIEYFTKIVTGEYSIDKFDEYVEKMNQNGAEELEKQTNEAWAQLQN